MSPVCCEWCYGDEPRQDHDGSLRDYAVRLYGPCPTDPACRLPDGHGGDHEPADATRRSEAGGSLGCAPEPENASTGRLGANQGTIHDNGETT